jgi:hypothetical protein
MDENEKTAPQKPESGKKLKLDLSEALNPGTDDDDDDDIIELKDEVKPPTELKEAKTDRRDQTDTDQPHHEPIAEKITAIEDFEEETGDQDSAVRLADNLAFDEEDPDDAKIPPPGSEQLLKADAAGDVEEITEFDDISSEENKELITLSDVDEELEPEDEFLELIDVEEEDLSEEEDILKTDIATGLEEQEEIEDEIIQFDDPADDVEDVELEDFINDSLGEEIGIDDDLEDELTSALGIETEPEMDVADSSSNGEEFDFSMESSEISEKIDQLDTLFFDDSESETEPDEEAESETAEVTLSDTDDETEPDDHEVFNLERQEEPQAHEEHAAFLDADPDQIEKSIERIIEQKFPGKIESMIKEIIEKAVSKEIDRLKNSLLEDDSAANG